MISDYME